MPIILNSPQLFRATDISIQRLDFSDPQEGKEKVVLCNMYAKYQYFLEVGPSDSTLLFL